MKSFFRNSVRLRLVLLPCACFALSWAAVRLVRHLLLPDPADGQASARSVQRAPLPPQSPPGRGGALAPATERLRLLRESLASRPPGEWSAIWSAFAASAGRGDFESLARENNTLPARLAEEELTIRSGQAPPGSGPGAFAALAGHDPGAAWDLVRTMGQSKATAAVLRILASRDPQDALRRWREMPARPAQRPLTADEAMEIGRVGVTHSALGSLFASWARKDPLGAEAAVDSLPLKLQSDARKEIAMAWALNDGPAALRYLSKHMAADADTRFWRVDMPLLTAFGRWPQESAALLREDAFLRGATQEWITPRAVPGMWFLADPETSLTFLSEKGNPQQLFSCKAVALDPNAAARLLRAVPPNPENPGRTERVLLNLALRDPEAGLALAREFQVLPAVESGLRQNEAAADPAAAVEKWLSALGSAQRNGESGNQNPDPSSDPDPDLAKTARESLGWTEETTNDLAAFAKARLPDKWRELERLLPPSKPSPDSASKPRAEKKPRRSDSVLFRDPAAALRTIADSNASPPAEAEVLKTTLSLAPHDPEATRHWLETLPPGATRNRSLQALARALCGTDPAASLALILTTPAGGGQANSRLWQESLQLLTLRGGDWRSWLARKPQEIELRTGLHRESVEEVLAGQAALLEALRTAAAAR